MTWFVRLKNVFAKTTCFPADDTSGYKTRLKSLLIIILYVYGWSFSCMTDNFGLQYTFGGIVFRKIVSVTSNADT